MSRKIDKYAESQGITHRRVGNAGIYVDLSAFIYNYTYSYSSIECNNLLFYSNLINSNM